MDELAAWIVDKVGAMGYTGITALMFLESSFFPFPSEVVMPPAGYLARQGDMDLFWVIISGVAGSLLGALFNYWISLKIGRPFFERYGRYLFVSKKTLDRSEVFFLRHGPFSTFTGRLLPGIRQYISLPAGIAKMPLGPFCLYTAAGAGIWVSVLTMIGYVIGKDPGETAFYLRRAGLCLGAFCSVLGVVYVFRIFRRR